MADNSTKIAAIESLLNSGVSRTTIGDTTVQHMSRAELLAELQRLKAGDDDSLTANTVRPKIASIKLSMF